MEFNELEEAVLERYWLTYRDRGFPSPGSLKMVRRTQTEVGCFVHLSGGRRSDLPDWKCNLPDGETLVICVGGEDIELEVNLYISAGQPVTLEIYGVRSNWRSAMARRWKLVARDSHYL